MVKIISIGPVEYVDGDIDVGFFLFVTAPGPPTTRTPPILDLELPHHDRDPSRLQRCNVRVMAPPRRREPIGERGEVVDPFDPLRSRPDIPLDQGGEVEPLQMGLPKAGDRVIEVRAVDETGDALRPHAGPRKRKPHEPEPVGAAGSSPAGLRREGTASSRMGQPFPRVRIVPVTAVRGEASRPSPRFQSATHPHFP